MEQQRYHTFLRVSLLTLLVMISWVFAGAVTFAGDPHLPDATAIYTENNLRWDRPVDNQFVADLDLFGAPAEGQALPLIHPLSADTYRLRLQNDVYGPVGYWLYVYVDSNEHNIPLTFDITMAEEMKPADSIPAALAGKQVLSSAMGRVYGQDAHTFEINWRWDSESDAADTALGDKAVEQDLIYTIRVLIVIEDNNVYGTGSPDSPAFRMHRAYVFGYPDGNFLPENPMTRAEVAAIFARLLAAYDESALTDTKTGFSDVAQTAWYAKYVAAVEEAGLMDGYPGRLFKPDDPISRAELAAVCVRYAQLNGVKLESKAEAFPDVSFWHWAKKLIAKAAGAGYIEGYPDGTFKPDAAITRAEVVTMVNRMLDRWPDEDYIDENTRDLAFFEDMIDRRYWAYYQVQEAANDHFTRVYKKTETWNPGDLLPPEQ